MLLHRYVTQSCFYKINSEASAIFVLLVTNNDKNDDKDKTMIDDD